MKNNPARRLRLFPESLEFPLRALITVVFLSGCLALLWSGWNLSRTLDARSLVLITLTLLSSWFAIRIPILTGKLQSLSITLSDIFIFIAIFYQRPELAVIAATVEGLISSYRVQVQHPHKWIFNAGLLSSAAFLSGWTFLLLTTTSSSLLTLLVAALATVCVYFGLNSLLISVVVSLSLEQKIWSIWSKHFLWAAPSSAANGMSAVCLVLVLSGVEGFLEFAMIPIVLVIFSAHRIHERLRMRSTAAE